MRDPTKHELRAVFEGAPVAVAVEGGVKSKPAQEAGIVVELWDRELLIPWSKVDELRASVRKKGQKQEAKDGE